MTPDDRSLVAAHRSGDRDAFAQLYERYIGKIYGFILAKTYHRETAEDLASQTFLQALQRIGQYDPGKGEFSAWLHRIARNLVIDHYRAKRPAQPIEDAWDLPSASDTAADADAAMKLDSVRSHMRELNPRQRELLMLRLWAGYSFAEIGAVLEMSEGAAKVAFHRTLASLRTDLAVLLLSLLSLRP